jgi:hypothetical protein
MTQEHVPKPEEEDPNPQVEKSEEIEPSESEEPGDEPAAEAI